LRYLLAARMELACSQTPNVQVDGWRVQVLPSAAMRDAEESINGVFIVQRLHSQATTVASIRVFHS
jgi:hypothetical protein